MARAPLLPASINWPWRGGLKWSSDRRGGASWQAGLRNADDVAEEAGQLWGWALARRGLRLRLLVVLRWVSIFGQTAAVVWVGLILRFHMPVLPCLAVIGAAAWLNLTIGL